MQPLGVGARHAAVCTAEAQRVEMINRRRAGHVEQEPPLYRALPPPRLADSTTSTLCPASCPAIAADAPAGP